MESIKKMDKIQWGVLKYSSIPSMVKMVSKKHYKSLSQTL
jgi:hypothetical protein